MEHLMEAMEARWEAEGDRCAFDDWTEGHVSYATLLDRVRRTAAALIAAGIQPGDRVVSKCGKSLDAIVAQFAVIRVGAIHNPVNPGFTAGELSYVVADAEPSLVLSDKADLDTDAPVMTLSDLAARARSMAPETAPPRVGGENALLMYTSGTTGRPKGALLAHRTLLALSRILGEAWEVGPNDRLLHVLPVFHGHGLILATYLPLLFGACIDFRPRFDIEDFCERIRKASIVMAVPTIYSRLVNANALTPETCSNMRLFVSGSAALPSHLHEAFQKMTNHVILERYGSTETGIVCTSPLRGKRKPGKVGLPLPGIEFKIAGPDGNEVPLGEVGQIQVRGHSVFNGYWKREREAKDFTADGFFIPGDLGRRDEDGYIEIAGRSKEMVISGGFNLYPVEIENALREDVAVRDVVVFGAPHPDFGEAAVAAVALAPGCERTAKDITTFLRDYLTSYKIPKKIIFTDDFPTNAMGKVQRNLLSERYRDVFQ